MTNEPNNTRSRSVAPDGVSLPAPTAWPITLAFGFMLTCAGMVTSATVSVLGAILMVAGCVGWFREVLPHERHEVVPFERQSVKEIRTSRSRVKTFDLAPEPIRAFLPIAYYPVSAGIKGGLAGSVAMAILAVAYGVVKQGSFWYPINLLAAAVYSQSLMLGKTSLNAFHLNSFLVAAAIHLITSLLVGLLYGAMLPMIPRRPILLGGFLAPILWSGLLYTTLGILNPMLDKNIDWTWFVISQFGFGIVAGLVVSRQEKVFTGQNLPFAVRAGIEVPRAEIKASEDEDDLAGPR